MPHKLEQVQKISIEELHFMKENIWAYRRFCNCNGYYIPLTNFNAVHNSKTCTVESCLETWILLKHDKILVLKSQWYISNYFKVAEVYKKRDKRHLLNNLNKRLVRKWRNLTLFQHFKFIVYGSKWSLASNMSVHHLRQRSLLCFKPILKSQQVTERRPKTDDQSKKRNTLHAFPTIPSVLFFTHQS